MKGIDQEPFIDSDENDVESIALLIANWDYHDPKLNLPGCQTDIEKMEEFLNKDKSRNKDGSQNKDGSPFKDIPDERILKNATAQAI